MPATLIRRRRRRGLRHELALPLFRWGFTLVAVTSVAFNNLGCALVSGGLAWLGFKCRPRRRKGARR